MIKICIAGKSKSGKNTFGELIKQHLSPKAVEIIAFADPIKEIAKIMFPSIPDVFLWGASELRNNIVPGSGEKTVREIIVILGKVGRSFNTNCWVNSLFDNFPKQADGVVISDLRFLNEYKRVKEENFTLVRIKRSINYVFNDISETELDIIPDSDFDFVIENAGTLEELSQKAREIL